MDRRFQKLQASLPENEAICFTDGAHPTHNVQRAYGWMRKGRFKEVPSNTGRSRLNQVGAIDINTYKIVPNLNRIERLRKWMKEKVVYNTYYQEFGDFRQAILGVFSSLSDLEPASEFGQQLRSRVTDNFRVVCSPL